MSKLIATFPSLAMALSQWLRHAGRVSLAEQIDEAVIARVTFDNAADAGYISLEPSRDLNAVETNIIGVGHGETISVETRFWTNIDTDNFDRLMGIEILDPRELKEELRKQGDVLGDVVD